jgi:hypothetical protein
MIASKIVNVHDQTKSKVDGHVLYFVGLRKALPTSLPRVLHSHQKSHSSFDKRPDPVPSDPARTGRDPLSVLLSAISSDTQVVID